MVSSRTLAIRTLCLGALVTFGLAAEPPARAQTTTRGRSSNLKGRKHIGGTVQQIVHTGLQSIDQGYERRGGKQACGQVNKLPGRFAGASGPFTLSVKRSTGITGGWCSNMEAVLNNYPGTSPPMGTIGPLVRAALDSSAASLQGPTPPTGKARRRCINTIGRVRSKIVHQVLAQAVRCQHAIDRTATSFGLISPTCLVPAPDAAARSRAVVQACAGFTGAAVGSCSPLPTC